MIGVPMLASPVKLAASRFVVYQSGNADKSRLRHFYIT